MKPFDLEAFKNGAVALDIDGDEVTFVGIARNNDIVYEYLGTPTLDSLYRSEESWLIKSWQMKPKPKVKKTGWIAIQKLNPASYLYNPTMVFPDKEGLLESYSSYDGFGKPFQITWEEDAE